MIDEGKAIKLFREQLDDQSSIERFTMEDRVQTAWSYMIPGAGQTHTATCPMCGWAKLFGNAVEAGKAAHEHICHIERYRVQTEDAPVSDYLTPTPGDQEPVAEPAVEAVEAAASERHLACVDHDSLFRDFTLTNNDGTLFAHIVSDGERFSLKGGTLAEKEETEVFDVEGVYHRAYDCAYQTYLTSMRRHIAFWVIFVWVLCTGAACVAYYLGGH